MICPPLAILNVVLREVWQRVYRHQRAGCAEPRRLEIRPAGLIILDIMMPMDGYGYLRRLKANPFARDR